MRILLIVFGNQNGQPISGIDKELRREKTGREKREKVLILIIFS